ncbi:hypothetical protein ES705_16642 [subsurface metagenome]
MSQKNYEFFTINKEKYHLILFTISLWMIDYLDYLNKYETLRRKK